MRTHKNKVISWPFDKFQIMTHLKIQLKFRKNVFSESFKSV